MKKKPEKLSMLMCFPGGNVALHKEWARASLIIASPSKPPSAKSPARSRCLLRWRLPSPCAEPEKLSMLLCFPDGNVALHKVGARASLIIASPEHQRKLAPAPRPGPKRSLSSGHAP